MRIDKVTEPGLYIDDIGDIIEVKFINDILKGCWLIVEGDRYLNEDDDFWLVCDEGADHDFYAYEPDLFKLDKIGELLYL